MISKRNYKKMSNIEIIFIKLLLLIIIIINFIKCKKNLKKLFFYYFFQETCMQTFSQYSVTYFYSLGSVKVARLYQQAKFPQKYIGNED